MSHIVTVQTQVRDAAAVRAACQRLGLPAAVQGKTRLFSGEVEGPGRAIARLGLSGGRAIPPADRSSYDNFSGRWGDHEHSTASSRRMPARGPRPKAPKTRAPMSPRAQLPDGSIKLTIQVQGGAA